MYSNVAFQHVASLRNISRCTASSLCSWIRSCATVLEPMSPSMAFLRAIRTFGSCRELLTWLTWYVDDPPAFRMYTPPLFIHFHQMYERYWGAGGQARRRKEVSRRFIHFYFWLNETWGGPALHQHKTIFGKPQECIPLGGELLLWTINSLPGKILKCMKHRGAMFIYCSNLDEIWWDATISNV